MSKMETEKSDLCRKHKPPTTTTLLHYNPKRRKMQGEKYGE